MKDLKILFIEDIDKKLSYTIHELIKQENGYYKLNHANPKINNNPNIFFKDKPRKYCYVITLENSILEVIYKDKVVKLTQVLENLYSFNEKKKEKNKVKNLIIK